MKKIFLLLAIIFIGSSSAFAQYENDDVYYTPEGFNKKRQKKLVIEIKGITQQEAFDLTIKKMLAEGYRFEQINDKYLFANTTRTVIPETEVIYSIFVDNYYIVLTGKFKTPFLNDWTDIGKWGMEGSPAYNAREDMEALFKTLQ